MAKQKTKLTTAAVYDRWLSTLGGGEQLAFAYAEVLRDLGYKTTLLTHRKLDVDLAEKKMNVNLKNIEIRYLPNLLDYQLSEYTEEYDIFISNSYLDYIPNRSKFGLLSIFFPSKIKVGLLGYFKRAHLVPSLRRFFMYPTHFEGFRYDTYEHRQLHKWLGEESSIYFNQPIHTFSIELHFEYLAFSVLDQIQFSFDHSSIQPYNRIVHHQSNTVTYTFRLHAPEREKPFTIHLPGSAFDDSISLIRFSIPNWRYFIYNLFKRVFPVWEMRLHGGMSATKLSDIESYDQIVGISEFTQHWVKKYWGISSQILYPPVSTNDFAPDSKKKNWIVHVGRFFVGGHSKKQLELVRVFKKLIDSGTKGWEFHLIGGVTEGDIHREYVRKIQEEIEGYPIFLHFELPFKELQSYLAKAKLYWHATGLDENENKNPIQMEHFGITTVEAMASGCVPLVLNKGGQPEIVTPESGYIWENREELLEKTKQLISNPVLLQKLSKGAIERSQFFSRQEFKERFQKLLPNN